MFENIVVELSLKEVAEIVQKKICEDNSYGTHKSLKPKFDENTGEIKFVAEFYRVKE